MDQPYRPGDVVAVKAIVESQRFTDPAVLYVRIGYHQFTRISPDDVTALITPHFEIGETVTVVSPFSTERKAATVEAVSRGWVMCNVGDDQPPLVMHASDIIRQPIPAAEERAVEPPPLSPEPDALPVEDAVSPAPEGVQF